MNEEKTIRLMEIAIDMLKGRLPEYDFDDTKWGNGCFQFTILKYNERTHRCIDCGDYSFYYDEDEEWAGSAEDQLVDFIDDVYSRFV